MVFFKKTVCNPQSENEKFEQLIMDFKEKCYLCEDKVDKRFLEIEHFLPKGNKEENPIRANSWGNLMLACSHCNKQKGTLEPILNPTLIDEEIDSKISFLISLDGVSKNGSKIVIQAADPSKIDEAMENTINLLNKIHNGEGYKQKIKSSEIREKIYNEINKFESYVRAYLMTENDKRKQELLISIKNELSNASLFTAFKRWIVKSNPDYEDFKQYIKDEE